MSWVLAFVGFAALVVFHELGHFAAAKAVGMRVERFALFFPPLWFRVKRGETEYAIGAVPLGGYVKITGMSPAEEIPPEHAHRAYYRQPVWKRIVVIAAGPLVNIVLFVIISWSLFVFYGVADPVSRPVVDRIETGSPAAGALQSGDRLLAVDGVRGDTQRLQDQVASHGCAAGSKANGCAAAEPARVTIVRDGRTQVVEVTPRYDAGRMRARLGFAFAVDENRETVPAATALGDSFQAGWNVTRITVESLGRLFYDAQARREVSGVVGSYESTRQAFKFDTARAIEILALISLSLAIINLLPFLPLDGGHIFWALAERIRRKPIPFSVMERASMFGILLVVALFALGLTNDIGRLAGEGFQVR